HNLIATISVGAAIAVTKAIPHFQGTLIVLGTPAEEGGGGKVIMVEKGCFDNVDCAMIIHPSDETMVDDISLANANPVFTFHGKAAHAAAFPHKGINALEAVIQTFNNINALRGHLKDDVRIHGIITQGGVASNIVPELAQAKFSVRALKRKDLDPVVEKVCQCAKAAALAQGARLEITTDGASYDEIMNNKVLTSLLKENYFALGEPVEERTIEQGLGSTDMGNVTQVVPGFQSYIGIGKGLATHTIEFREHSGGPEGHRGLNIASKALAMTVVDLFTNPDLVAQAQAEFKKSKEE
ncbi:MAG: amidohydrolase, partial [Peptococcales bacterium]